MVKTRLLLVMLLIALGAVRSVHVPIRIFTTLARTGPDRKWERLLARFERLAPYLLTRDRVGYLWYSIDSTGHRREDAGRYMRAQYALAPSLIEPYSNQRLVIFDSDDPAAHPETADHDAWQLVVDLGDGLQLFRRPLSQ